MTLFLVLVIGMVGRAIMLVGPGALALTDSSRNALQAQRASESGLQYATAKLRDNPAWRGDDNRVTVNVPGMFVVEEQGNVVGLIKDRSGAVSQFRLRFNYQDGDPGADNLPDPPSELRIDNIFVSVNNLDSSIEVPIPRAEEESWDVTAPDQGPHELPGGAACIIVEGRAGPGLGTHTSGAPNEPPSGPVKSHIAEAYLVVSLNEPTNQASMMGGSDIAFDLLPGGKVEMKADDSTPRLRSKGAVTIQSGGQPAELRMENGEVSRDLVFEALTKEPVKEIQESVGDGKDFFNLKWEDVARADSDPATTSAIQIPGGTYVNWDDGTIHYYDMDLSDYKAHIQANPSDSGVVVSGNLKEVRSSTNLANVPEGLEARGRYSSYTGRWKTRWKIERDLSIQTSPSGVNDFAVIPRSGASFSPADATDLITLPTPDSYTTDDVKFELENAILSGQGDIVLFSELRGKNATVTAESRLRLITADTKLENKGGDKGDDGDDGDKGDKDGGLGLGSGLKELQLNLYVKDDILVSTYDNGKFRDIRLEGLVYTWGDFVANLADTNGSSGSGGDFELRGALVAYGADPQTESPGSEGKGRIAISSKQAKIEWDDKKMAGVLQLGTPSVTLRRSLYNVY